MPRLNATLLAERISSERVEYLDRIRLLEERIATLETHQKALLARMSADDKLMDAERTEHTEPKPGIFSHFKTANAAAKRNIAAGFKTALERVDGGWKVVTTGKLT